MILDAFYGRPEDRDEAIQNAVKYGTYGMLDPRTYTIEPWILVKRGMTWRAALALTTRYALIGSMVIAGVSLAYDMHDSSSDDHHMMNYLM